MSVRLVTLEDGALARIVLDAGKGNIVDRACVEELSATFARAFAEKKLRAILLDHEGPHFSFGASVPEHLPGTVEAMLPEFHRLVLQLVKSPLPVVACVRGACLGGGLELALACSRIIAAPTAKLGQPEIQLGVFAPAGSVLLPLRVGEAKAVELLLGGGSLTGSQALQIGLVDEIAEEPREAALAWCRTHLLPRSAAVLRLAHQAARLGLVEQTQARLPLVEKMYLEELMNTRDAVEGLRAFLDKRAPTWADE